MILCQISDAERYKNISPAIAEAIEWLGAHVKDEFVKGSVELGDTGIRVNSEEVALRPRENAVLEAHRRYIDIHVPLKGRESIGWAAVYGLNYPRDKYDEESDIIFYGDSATTVLHVNVGQIAIFFPEDAHAPNIGLGNHRKLCIKIPV